MIVRRVGAQGEEERQTATIEISGSFSVTHQSGKEVKVRDKRSRVTCCTERLPSLASTVIPHYAPGMREPKEHQLIQPITMGTPGLEIVRFRGRYYIRWHRLDSYFEGLGAKIIASIPADPEAYQSTL